MKKIVSIILISILFLLVSCNKQEFPTDTIGAQTSNSTTKVTETQTTESETMSPVELKQSLKLKVPLVEDYKIVIPKQFISYIEYHKPIDIDSSHFSGYESTPGDVFIFRSQEKIEEIVTFLENIPLEYAHGMLMSTRNSEDYEIHFTDGTWISFSICQRTLYGGYLRDDGEIELWYYRISAGFDMQELKTVICK